MDTTHCGHPVRSPPDRCIGSVSGQTAAGSHRSDGGNKNQCRHDYLRPVTGQHGSSPQFGILPPLSHLFAGDVRQVELNGEAYFDVTHHPRKRFIVSTPHHSQVEVYGTSFNVEAYGNETPISTTLIKGSVGFIYKNNKGKIQKSMLSPRQKLVYSPQTGDIKCYVTSGESEISWKDGKLIFNDTPLDEVLHMLGKRFNVEFVLSNKELKGCSFTGTFTHQRLERIMEYFRISSRIRWRYIDSADIKTEKLKIEVY